MVCVNHQSGANGDRASEPNAECLDLCRHVYTSWGSCRLVATVSSHLQSFLLQLKRRQNATSAAASDIAARGLSFALIAI